MNKLYKIKDYNPYYIGNKSQGKGKQIEDIKIFEKDIETNEHVIKIDIKRGWIEHNFGNQPDLIEILKDETIKNKRKLDFKEKVFMYKDVLYISNDIMQYQDLGIKLEHNNLYQKFTTPLVDNRYQLSIYRNDILKKNPIHQKMQEIEKKFDELKPSYITIDNLNIDNMNKLMELKKEYKEQVRQLNLYYGNKA